MAFEQYREQSKRNWGTELGPGQKLNEEQIRLGCQLRIADAVEKMAIRYDELIQSRDEYKRWFSAEREANGRLLNQIAGLKGAITRMKKNAKKG